MPETPTTNAHAGTRADGSKGDRLVLTVGTIVAIAASKAAERQLSVS